MEVQGSGCEVHLSRRAFAKMILHVAKYPHCAVNGLLLTNAPSSSKLEDQSLRKSPSTDLVDCVPLFHQAQGLTPMVEVALAQVELLASSLPHQPLAIAGYYHANENFSDCGVDIFSQRTADAIAGHCPASAALITVDNRRLGLAMETSGLLAQVKVDGKWRPRESCPVVLQEGALEVTTAMLQKRVQEDLVDFDNHLDDLSKDFLNAEVNVEIDQCSD